MFAITYVQEELININNHFWKDVFHNWEYFTNSIKKVAWLDFTNEPIWYNNSVNIVCKTVCYYKKWLKKVSDTHNNLYILFSILLIIINAIKFKRTDVFFIIILPNWSHPHPQSTPSRTDSRSRTDPGAPTLRRKTRGQGQPQVPHVLVQTTYGQITPCPVQTRVLQDQV